MYVHPPLKKKAHHDKSCVRFPPQGIMIYPYLYGAGCVS